MISTVIKVKVRILESRVSDGFWRMLETKYIGDRLSIWWQIWVFSPLKSSIFQQKNRTSRSQKCHQYKNLVTNIFIHRGKLVSIFNPQKKNWEFIHSKQKLNWVLTLGLQIFHVLECFLRCRQYGTYFFFSHRSVISCSTKTKSEFCFPQQTSEIRQSVHFWSKMAKIVHFWSKMAKIEYLG